MLVRRSVVVLVMCALLVTCGDDSGSGAQLTFHNCDTCLFPDAATDLDGGGDVVADASPDMVDAISDWLDTFMTTDSELGDDR